MIKWPAIIQFENSDELEIVLSQSEWNKLNVQNRTDLRVIDYKGSIFKFSEAANTAPQNTQIRIDLAEAVEIARVHMAAQDQCCVSKYNARSIKEVIDTLVATDDLS